MKTVGIYLDRKRRGPGEPAALRRVAGRDVLRLMWGAALIALVVTLTTLAARHQVAAQSSQAEAGIWYVDWEATGGNSGLTWADAYVDLQLALDAAQAGDEIWVAAGTYSPSVEHGGSGPRHRAFQMLNGVGIYGGFDPSVGDIGWEDRDWLANETVLSGDIGVPGNITDNTYHVLYHPSELGLDQTAVLDGFTIAKGNANGGGMDANGGGMLNIGASPTVANCTFELNRCYSRGAGLYNETAAPVLAGVTFQYNTSEFYGGGLFNQESSPTVHGCTFLRNSAWSVGGGVANQDSSPEFFDCVFLYNDADEAAGGMVNWGGTPILSNCRFEGNEATVPGWAEGGAVANAEGSSPIVTNCVFSRNTAQTFGGAVLNAEATPTMTNCSFHANSAGEEGGAVYTYLNASPVLANCVLWGNVPDEIVGGEPVVTYSDVRGGWPGGEGNIDQDPLWVDPDEGNYHLREESPCIDAGSNDAPNLPPYDFEGNDRIMDGDGDGTATADMGVDEVYPFGEEPITGLVADNNSPTPLGEVTTLAASVETGNGISYAWALGDGSYDTGKIVDHTYPAAGVYTAVVTATNEVSELTAETVVTVEEAIGGLEATNDGPTALGRATTLTASVTAGSDVFYSWALGDGSYASGQVVSYVYPDLGTYTAIVTATNLVSWQSSTTTVTITSPVHQIYLPMVLRSD